MTLIFQAFATMVGTPNTGTVLARRVIQGYECLPTTNPQLFSVHNLATMVISLRAYHIRWNVMISLTGTVNPVPLRPPPGLISCI
jgi:hypothetical protein